MRPDHGDQPTPTAPPPPRPGNNCTFGNGLPVAGPGEGVEPAEEDGRGQSGHCLRTGTLIRPLLRLTFLGRGKTYRYRYYYCKLIKGPYYNHVIYRDPDTTFHSDLSGSVITDPL